MLGVCSVKADSKWSLARTLSSALQEGAAG